jgi:hypothetical protein
MRNFRDKFGEQTGDAISVRLHELVVDFLHDTKDVKSHKAEAESELGSEANSIKAH